MRSASYILTTTFLALSLGCSSDSTSVAVVAPPDPCIEFVSAETPAPGTVTSRLGTNSACLLAAVEVVGTDINDAFAVAAHVEYDTSAVDFVSMSTTGSALSQDGAQLFARVEEDPFGELTVGVARNADTPVDIVGTRLLVTLYFRPVALRTGDLTIQTPCLTDGAESPAPRDDVACSGGTFTVVNQNQ